MPSGCGVLGVSGISGICDICDGDDSDSDTKALIQINLRLVVNCDVVNG